MEGDVLGVGQTFIHAIRDAGRISPALDLMRHGFLAKTPTRPTAAVSVKTLELLYRLRQRKASYSIEAFTKVLCDYYQIPYRRHLRELVADTFEVYLRIIRHLEKQVYDQLGWKGPDWRPKNACRACCYKLEDEPPLRFSRMYAMDGNNSLKRLATTSDRVAADTRILDDSTYFVSRQFVDRYANEIRGRNVKGPAVKTRDDNSSDEEVDDGEGGTQVEGDPTDGLQQQCVDNWKSAAKEESKRMWSIFDESGVFASACRHGLILWIMDMVKSGELAKYPLATVAKVLENLGEDTLGGYDIGCALVSTVQRSSLAQAFHEKNGSFCVCAFHGYSHCHTCQMQFHPNNLKGAGLEDLETMERIFSASNQLASVTRYASPYRRRLFMEAYFRQWDEDKTLNTGTFILSNYKQALEILEHDGEVLREGMKSLAITSADMDAWEHEELCFFSHLGEEAEYDVHAVAYVELLQELRDLEPKRAQATARFLHYAPSSESSAATYRRDLAATRRLESERRHAKEQYERVSLEICALEVEMGLTVRWTPATPQYMDALKYIKERKYRRALNKLQKLVTQRLFELHKLNVAQTGYKMRTHIAKSLQTRSKTIQRAVKAYNAAAATLDPPRPVLDWAQVTSFNFLEEFTLLQDTRNDIRDREWSKPAVREAMKLRHRLMRAQEEVDRLNVEVRRLHTAIRDETALFSRVLRRLKADGDLLLGPTSEFITRRKRCNVHLLARIQQVHGLKGFTGLTTPGTRTTARNDEQRSDKCQVAVRGFGRRSQHLQKCWKERRDDDEECSSDGGRWCRGRMPEKKKALRQGS
ncbi:hypothetical protein BDW22DRAFT_1462444 [Trametopsis cervina]|nr:hypothetical protein BDW22DRAFT_1462444 [Trametopsis cervina]